MIDICLLKDLYVFKKKQTKTKKNHVSVKIND